MTTRSASSLAWRSADSRRDASESASAMCSRAARSAASLARRLALGQRLGHLPAAARARSPTARPPRGPREPCAAASACSRASRSASARRLDGVACHLLGDEAFGSLLGGGQLCVTTQLDGLLGSAGVVRGSRSHVREVSVPCGGIRQIRGGRPRYADRPECPMLLIGSTCRQAGGESFGLQLGAPLTDDVGEGDRIDRPGVDRDRRHAASGAPGSFQSRSPGAPTISSWVLGLVR